MNAQTWYSQNGLVSTNPAAMPTSSRRLVGDGRHVRLLLRRWRDVLLLRRRRVLLLGLLRVALRRREGRGELLRGSLVGRTVGAGRCLLLVHAPGLGPEDAHGLAD